MYIWRHDICHVTASRWCHICQNVSPIPSNRYAEAIFAIGIIKKVTGEKRQGGGTHPPPPLGVRGLILRSYHFQFSRYKSSRHPCFQHRRDCQPWSSLNTHDCSRPCRVDTALLRQNAEVSEFESFNINNNTWWVRTHQHLMSKKTSTPDELWYINTW